MKYTEKEVVGILKEFKDSLEYGLTVESFAKEKGLIKKEFEVGKWYKGKRYNRIEVLFVCGLNSYGFYDGSFIDLEDFSSDYLSDEDYGYELRPATDKEVETALIKEGHKRNLKEGVNVGNFNNVGLDSELIHSDSYSFSPEFNLFFMGGSCVFRNGKWATSIEEPKVEVKFDEFNYVLNKEIKELRALKNK